MANKGYRVDKLVDGMWCPLLSTKTRSRQYCEGWVDCACAHYPSYPHRIVEIVDGELENVIRNTKGHGGVTVN